MLTKAPSAELRPNQTDQDSLPPYDVLDDILQRHIERHQPADEIVAAGFDPATVRRVLRLVRARRVQAQAGGARAEGDRPRIRHRLAHADRGEGRILAMRRSDSGYGLRKHPATRISTSSPVSSRQRRCIHSHSSGMAADVHLEHVGAALRELANRHRAVGARRLDRMLVNHPVAAAGERQREHRHDRRAGAQRQRGDRRRRRRRPLEEIDVDRIAAHDVLIDQHARRRGPPAAAASRGGSFPGGR